MKNIPKLLLPLCLLIRLHGQDVHLSMDTVMAAPNDTIPIDLYVNEVFNQVDGAQFSLNWDSEMLKYVEYSAPSDNFQMTDDRIATGKLGVVWNKGLDTLTFDPNSPFLTLYFKVIGQDRDSATVQVAETPVPALFVGCCSQDTLDPIYPIKIFDWAAGPGLVEIGNSLALTETLIVDPVCSDDPTGSISLMPAGGKPPYRFSWRGPEGFVSADQNLAGLSEGMYRLTMTDERATTLQDSFLLQAKEEGEIQALLDPSDLFMCAGENIELIARGGTSYTWIDTTHTLLFDPDSTDVAHVSPPYSATFGVIAETACAIDTAFVDIIVNRVTGSAGRDTCIGRGDHVQLRATGGAGYRWLPGAYPLDDYAVPNPTSRPEESTYYTVEITDVNGCTLIDSVYVAVAENPLFFIRPVNIITPNGDGINDYLEFAGLEKYRRNSLQIFNRWGDILYKKIGYQTDADRWEGHFEGKELPPGAYFYLLRIGDEHIKQTITILK